MKQFWNLKKQLRWFRGKQIEATWNEWCSEFVLCRSLTSQKLLTLMWVTKDEQLSSLTKRNNRMSECTEAHLWLHNRCYITVSILPRYRQHFYWNQGFKIRRTGSYNVPLFFFNFRDPSMMAFSKMILEQSQVDAYQYSRCATNYRCFSQLLFGLYHISIE